MTEQTPTTTLRGASRAGAVRRDGQRIETEVGKVIVGQPQLVGQTLIACSPAGTRCSKACPGSARRCSSARWPRRSDLGFPRIQFTPDLMPADIIGTNIIVEEGGDGASGSSRADLRNLVLADEINRATPKTQSALLEAMQEHRVTVAKQKYKLPEPFFVLATQNPLEMEGTYPLPEAQLDRFFFKIDVPFPAEADLVRILDRTTGTEQPTVGKAATAPRC